MHFPLRRRLLCRRCAAHQRGPADVARFALREGPGAVHGALIVPHDEIADGPLVRIDELALGGGFRQVEQEGLGFRFRPLKTELREILGKVVLTPTITTRRNTTETSSSSKLTPR